MCVPYTNRQLHRRILAPDAQNTNMMAIHAADGEPHVVRRERERTSANELPRIVLALRLSRPTTAVLLIGIARNREPHVTEHIKNTPLQ